MFVLFEKVVKLRQCIDLLCENGWFNRIDKVLEIMWDGLIDIYVRGEVFRNILDDMDRWLCLWRSVVMCDVIYQIVLFYFSYFCEENIWNIFKVNQGLVMGWQR